MLIAAGTGVSALPQDAQTTTAGVEEVRQLNQKGRSADAERRSRELLTEAERRFGPDSVETASVLDVLVESLQQAGKSRDPDAMPSAERALRIKEARLGPDHKDVAVTLTALAGVQANTGRYPEARATLQRTLAIREKALGPGDPLTATTLGNLATTMSEFLGEVEAARPLFERAFAISERAYGPDHIALGRLSFNAARNALRRDDPGRAREYLERALAIFEKQYGPEHPMIGNTLSSLGMAERFLGRYAEAQPRFERAIAVLEKAVGPDHEWVANAVNDLGLLMWQLGDYSRARAAYERSLKIWTAKGSSQAGAPLNNLAILARRTGDYVEARGLYERSIAMKEKSFGPDHVEVALAVHNLGNLLGDVGDHAAARRLFERAIAIRTAKLGPSHSLVASSRYGRATSLAGLGQRAAAHQEFTAAIEIWRKASAESPDVAEGLRGLAAFLEDGGQLRDAEAHYREALTLYEKAYGNAHLEVGSVLNSLAALSARRGAVVRARALSERALPILESVLGTASAQAARALALQADLHLRSRDWQLALDKALRAEAAGREQFQLTARALSERQALDYAGRRASGLDVALSALADNTPLGADAASSVHDAIVRSRAMVLDEIASRHRPSDTEPELGEARARLAETRQRLANLLVRGADGKPDEYQRILAQSRRDKDAAEEALAARSVRFRDERARVNLGARDVRNALPADGVLVTFVRYDRQRPGARPLPSYAAFVAGQTNQPPAFIPLGSATAIDALVRGWKAEVARPSREGAIAMEAAYRETAALLRARIWDPLKPSFGGATTMFIVPDGALNLVAFAALPSGPRRYIADTGPRLHYLSSERDLTMAAATPSAGRGLLVIGNPAFDAGGASAVASTRGAPDECVDFAQIRFDRLPATAREVDAVADLWRRSPRSDAAGGVLQLSGAEAQESAFKRDAAGRSLLHLATHGFFLSGRCAAASSSPNRRGVGGLATARPPENENPLLLSGLAMAGANRRRTAQQLTDDGILTAEEIAALDLRAAQLVVLSACDTGLGEVRAGEGVFGLRRAFRVAGARSLVTSLWAVDDQAALSWMMDFYNRRLVLESSILESVHLATAERLAARRAKGQTTHPFYWAGFVAAGDWR